MYSYDLGTPPSQLCTGAGSADRAETAEQVAALLPPPNRTIMNPDAIGALITLSPDEPTEWDMPQF